jgi:hypothetical protein
MTSRRISEFVAIAALIILLTYITDAAIGQGKSGFLPLTAGQRGMLFGTSSIVLFFVAIGIGFKERSRVTGGLVTAGGAIMGTSVLVASAIGEGGLGSIRSSFLGIIIVGYIIMGMGILMLVRTKKAVG